MQTVPDPRQKQEQVTPPWSQPLSLRFTRATVTFCLLEAAGPPQSSPPVSHLRKSLPRFSKHRQSPTQTLSAQVDNFLLLVGQFGGVLSSPRGSQHTYAPATPRGSLLISIP